MTSSRRRGFGNLGTETREEFEWDDVDWSLSGGNGSLKEERGRG